MPFLRKYATGTGSNIAIPMVKAGSSDYATSSDWTPATGDVKLSIDGGSQANITTLPTYTNGDWVFTFSNAELTGKKISVRIVDSATKAVEDTGFNIETFGHASAQKLIDYTNAAYTSPGSVGGLAVGDQGYCVRRRNSNNVVTYYPAAADTNASRGLQLAAAVSAASSGDRIEILANAASTNAIGGKDGITWHVPAGVTIFGNGTTESDCIIYDGASSVKMKVVGEGRFISNIPQSPVAIINSASVLYMEFDEIAMLSTDPLPASPMQAIYAESTAELYMVGRKVYSGNYDGIVTTGNVKIHLEADYVDAFDNALEYANATASRIYSKHKRLRSFHTGDEAPIYSNNATINLGQTNDDCDIYVESDVIEAVSWRAIQQNNDTGTPKIIVKCPKIMGCVTGTTLTLIGGGVIDSTGIAAASLTLTGSNVTLIGDWKLVTKSTETYSITAASAMTLTVIGSLTYNKAVHSNVTIVYQTASLSTGIKAKTDQLTFTTANVVDASSSGGGASAADIAAAIRAIIPTTVGNPFIATKDLAAIPAASAHQIQWTVLNNGAAVDLTGKTVRCVFALVTDAGAVDDRTDDTLSAEFSYQTGGDGIVISGTSSNIVTLTHSVTKTATPGAFKYWLWNITDNVVLARGRAPIEAAAKSV